jgi:hypothetical protein
MTMVRAALEFIKRPRTNTANNNSVSGQTTPKHTIDKAHVKTSLQRSTAKPTEGLRRSAQALGETTSTDWT